MAIRYLLFNSTPNDRRKYHSQDFADINDATHESGLLHPYGQGQNNLRLEVKEGMSMLVGLGRATILGHYVEVYGEPEELTHLYPDTTYNRIDRVVLRMDRTQNERNILPHIKAGNPAATPQAPALTRNKDIYEISLGQILVRANTGQLNGSDLIDERFDDELCGPAYLKLPIRPEQIQDVMDAWFADEDKEMYLKRSEMGVVGGIAPYNDFTSLRNDYNTFKGTKAKVNGLASLDGAGRVPFKQMGYYSPSDAIIRQKTYPNHSGNIQTNFNTGRIDQFPDRLQVQDIGKFRVTFSVYMAASRYGMWRFWFKIKTEREGAKESPEFFLSNYNPEWTGTKVFSWDYPDLLYPGDVFFIEYRSEYTSGSNSSSGSANLLDISLRGGV